MKIVFLSHTANDNAVPFKVGSHFLADEFAKMGHKVVHVATPYSYFHKLKNFIKRTDNKPPLKKIFTKKGVLHVNLQTVFPQGILSHKSKYKKILNNYLDADIILIDQQTFYKLLSLFKTQNCIYRPTDISVKFYKKFYEKLILKKVKKVVATSKIILNDIKQKYNYKDGIVLENGVLPSNIKNPINKKSNTKNKMLKRTNTIIYIGAIDNRFDFKAIEYLAKNYSGQIDLYGPLNNMQTNSTIKDSAKNVNYKGPVNNTKIFNLLESAKIGIMPFNNNKLNSSRSPMKFYEYLFAELWILSKATPELTIRKNIPGVFLYNNLSEIPNLLKKIQNLNGTNKKGAEFAYKNTWPKIAKKLIAYCKK
jgi:hypothetical protein